MKTFVSFIFVLATFWIALVCHACILNLGTVFYPGDLPFLDRETFFYPGILSAFSRPDRWVFGGALPGLYGQLPRGYNGWYNGILPLSVLCLYVPSAMLWKFPKPNFRWIPCILLVFTSVSILVWLFLIGSHLLPYNILVRIITLGSVTWIAIQGERLRQLAVNKLDDSDLTQLSSTKPRKRHDLGFTALELIVVVAIIAILAAIIYPTIMSSKRSARTTVEISKLSQIYIAINLYEGDSNHASPRSLVDLTNQYVNARYLRSETDARNTLQMATWPANPWVTMEGYDLPEYIIRRAPTINSYFYLKSFEGRFPTGLTFGTYRSNPKLGLIASGGLLECTTCQGANCVGNCEYLVKISNPLLRLGQPAANLHGLIPIVRMDGSIYVRRRPDTCRSYLGEHQLFFDESLACKELPVTIPQ